MRQCVASSAAAQFLRPTRERRQRESARVRCAAIRGQHRAEVLKVHGSAEASPRIVVAEVSPRWWCRRRLQRCRRRLHHDGCGWRRSVRRPGRCCCTWVPRHRRCRNNWLVVVRLRRCCRCSRWHDLQLHRRCRRPHYRGSRCGRRARAAPAAAGVRGRACRRRCWYCNCLYAPRHHRWSCCLCVRCCCC